MSSSRNTPARQPRVTTPTSPSMADAVAAGLSETPHNHLRQLAGLIRKPAGLSQDHSIQGLPTNRAPGHRTPAAGRTPAGQGATLQRSTALNTPTTPHTHTLRALQKRRAAALTAERTRRRSARLQRETPRDTLRQLSKILAPETHPIKSSPDLRNLKQPQSILEQDEDEDDGDLDDDPEPEAPRLSLPIEPGDDDDDEDDGEYLPPRPQEVPVHFDGDNDDDDITQHSPELPRRALPEPLGTRRLRASFGSIRLSDRFADLNELEQEESSDGAADDGSAGSQTDDLDDADGQADADASRDSIEHADETDTRGLHAAYFDADTPEHESFEELRLQAEDGDDLTFALNILQPMEYELPTPASLTPHASVPPRQDSPRPDLDLMDASGLLDEDDVESGSSMDDSPMPLSPARESVQPAQAAPAKAPRQKKVPRPPRVSRHGISYPSLPIGVVKRLATNLARSVGGGKAHMSKDTLEAIMDASDWFFEQVSDDLGAYAEHAGRTTIDESDMIALMKRQRQINSTTTPFSLAQRYLPRELVQKIRMTPVTKPQPKRKSTLAPIAEADDET